MASTAAATPSSGHATSVTANATASSRVAEYRPDLFIILGFILAATVYSLVVLRPIHDFIRGDWTAQFFPVYSYLGERLRAFDIPGWNPRQFSGAPFAGDPESGWAYLPAMLIYAIFPAEPATIIYIGSHIAFAAIATYLLARVLGLSRFGGGVAGASFAFAWVAPGAMQLVIFFPVAIWLVVSLIGIERAIRAATWSGRLGWWLLAAIALSQMLAAWLGQASYYIGLTMGAWIAYRTLLTPDRPTPLTARIRNCLVHGLAVFGFGALVSATAVLPRLAMVSQSNLAGGVYDVESTWELAQTGYSGTGLILQVVGGYAGALWYAGAAAVALALMAPLVAFGWRPIWFFVATAAASLLLASDATTPLHVVLYTLLPRFEGLHEHSPERALLILGPSVAMLAGASVTYLTRWRRQPIVILFAAAVPALLAILVTAGPWLGPGLISRAALTVIVSTCVLAVLAALAPSRALHIIAMTSIVALALWEPAGRIATSGYLNENLWNHSLQSSLGTDSTPFLYDNGPARFIAEQTAESPGRYAGFDPALLPSTTTIDARVPDIGYRGSRAMKNPIVNWLLVYNWGTWFGIDDIQGYNPIQTKRYVEYMDAVNTHGQEYHERDLYPRGVNSPLLDPLNLRYLIVPADSVRRGDIAPLVVGLDPVYEDSRVRVLERPSAFPRAWLVHSARQVGPGQALPLLADGAVDPRQEALLEQSPPTLEPAEPGVTETATFSRYEADRLELNVTASSAALLMLSEIWDPGWSATVNGQPAPVLEVNHMFRAVPVPAGDSSVELRYDAPWLLPSLAISLASALVVFVAALALRQRPAPRREAKEAMPT